ncbi:alpha carbonic anhydrase 7-like [Canna indica]|uniref:Carbonic anhydrase n=1 Tax=Canna indica TaxID=4628 RepID=A0AAQ3KPZ6_9LILI|nr:alpha carbonic anhydrase 7-like [Canna indica]
MAFQVLSALFALLILQAIAAASAQEFSYDPTSPFGPANWGGTCASGQQQSPISIETSNIVNQNLGCLQNDYTQSQASLVIEGHAVRVNWNTSPGSLTIDGKTYNLQQCHWHSPSEHHLDGRRYALELHMVHTISASEVAVVAVLYDLGGPNDFFLDKLVNGLNELKTKVSVDLGNLEPPLIGAGEPYFRYSGSLTTPPCSQTVTWTVMQKVQRISNDQLNSLRAPANDKDNARPIQAINGRTVSLSQSC